ncbi:FixH family protein [Devosia sp. SL43]|uniref:FixH family protein n=1 Tax=Devosia sp. SL43 TaxID=2806348 RepID=UPI001F348184|nr:FixH family protein [Devosia sp. SL43]UJW85565.1 FixH family protein [Devosia sp. SL43]
MSKASSGEFTGRHMLLITVAFFGVIVTVNAIMAVSASRTWTGLVVQNSYVASQEFQEKADAISAQHKAGWSFGISYEAGVLVLTSEGNARSLELADVQAFIHRPVGGHDDATIALSATPRGYEAPIDLASGAWDVSITTAPTSLGVVEREARISVP